MITKIMHNKFIKNNAWKNPHKNNANQINN